MEIIKSSFMELEKNMNLQIEALLFATDIPLAKKEILTLLNAKMEIETDLDNIETHLNFLVNKYSSNEYAFEIVESGGGFQFLTKKEYHNVIKELNGDKYVKRLSNSALETLSIVAYKQPVTKVEIEEIRGVSSDYSIQRLLERELIYISGRKEDSIGKPLLYQTTKSFMDYLGINAKEDLPKLSEIIKDEQVEPIDSIHADPYQEEAKVD